MSERFLGRSGASYLTAANRDICELALDINEEKGGGQNISDCLKEAMRRLGYDAPPQKTHGG